MKNVSPASETDAEPVDFAGGEPWPYPPNDNDLT